MMKPDSNYNQGMRPLIYSVKEAEKYERGWHRDGYNISYYQSARKKKNFNNGSGPTRNSSESTASSVSANLK